MAEFDLMDVVRLSSLELFNAGIVPQEDKGKGQVENQLKIQLLFFGRRVEKKAQEIITQEEIKKLRPLLGEKILIKFKVGEEVFKRCQQLGLRTGSKCDWDAVPQLWVYKEANGNSRSGIWYQPAALLRLDGKDINYQILQTQSNKPAMQDAFAYFALENSNNTHAGNNWDASLGNLEQQINSELEHA